LILGNDYADCISWVMDQRGWTKIVDEVLILAYRGSGKSTVISASVAVFLKGIPSYDAMVYSGNVRKSRDLLDNIWSVYTRLVERDQEFRDAYIGRKTQDCIIINKRDGTDNRTVRAASSISRIVSSHLPSSLSLVVGVCMLATSRLLEKNFFRKIFL